MKKQTSIQRSLIVRLIKPQYLQANNLTSLENVNDIMLFRWFFQSKNISYPENLSKAIVIKMIYERLQNNPFEKTKRIVRRPRPTKKIDDSTYRDFYDTLDWQWLKTKILRLYGTKCMKCSITNVEMHVDHIKPRSKHIELQLSPSNLQVLCRSCNLEKSNIDENDYRTDVDKLKLSKFLQKK